MQKIKEEWKCIRQFEGLYEVSNTGLVRSTKSKKLKVASLNKSGYLQVCLSKNNRPFLCRVHRLVATEFVPNPNDFPIVNHKDECKTNNHSDNLEWCTPEYNVNYLTGNIRRSMSHSKPIIQYSLDGEFIKEWSSATEAARVLGFPQSSINWCCLRKPKHNSCRGFLWRYKFDKEPVTYINGKRVNKYSKDGIFLAEYNNITEAAQKNNILISSIVNCLHGRSKSAGGFLWKTN